MRQKIRNKKNKRKGLTHFFFRIFIGFGFLTAFLRRHRFGSLTYVLLLSVLAVQWGLLVNGFFLNYLGAKSGDKWMVIDMTAALNALFSAAALLISFGVWIGKVGGEILLLLGILETILQGLNNWIVTYLIGTSDIGGTIGSFCETQVDFFELFLK